MSFLIPKHFLFPIYIIQGQKSWGDGEVCIVPKAQPFLRLITQAHLEVEGFMIKLT